MNKLLALLLICLLSSVSSAETELPSLGDSTSGLISLQQERELGQLWLRQLRSQAPTLNHPLLLSWFYDRVYQLVPSSNLQEPNLELVIVDSPELNAFAVPGGIIGINFGLLLYTDDEDELSSVLAHELAHLSQRHFARQVEASQRRNPVALATLLASIILIATNNPDAGFAGLVGGQAAAIQNQLAYSRDFEREADRLGMTALANSGFDPHAMPDMFDNMLTMSRYQNTALEFLMTHPLTATRVADAAGRAEQYPPKARHQSFEFLVLKLEAEKRYRLKDAAAAEFERRLKHETVTMQAALRFQLGDIALENKEYELGLNWVDSIKDNNNPAIAVLKADLLAKIDQKEEAIQLLREQLLTHPKDLNIRMSLAELLQLNLQANTATTMLKALTTEYPTRPEIWRALSRSAKASDDLILAYRALAESHYYSGRRQDAIQNFHSALREATKKKDFMREAALRERLKVIDNEKTQLSG